VPEPAGPEGPDADPLSRLRGLLAVDAGSDAGSDAGRDRAPRRAAPRWSLPAAAGLAALVLVAAVAGLLLLRTATTVPSAQTTPVGPVAAASAPCAAAPVGAPTTPSDPTAATPSPSAATEVVVHVVGQVRAPGLVRLPAGARVADAVDAAGGLTGEADTARTNLARLVVDGEQLVVPRPGEEVVAASPAPAAGGAGPAGAASAGAPTAAGPVSLASATLAELDALPGLGPVLAQRILDWREEHGGFSSVEELGEVAGIGDTLLERLRPLVGV